MNIVLSRSQQSWNKCVMGDSEQGHCGLIANEIEKNLKFYDCKILNIPAIKGTESQTLQEVVKQSNDFKGNLHIDIHTDAGYDTGASALYKSEAGKKIATPIYNELKTLTPWNDGNLRQVGNMYVLNNTICPAVIIEVSRHDVKLQAQWIHEHIKGIADAITRGIVIGMNLSPKEDEFCSVIRKYSNSPDYWVENCQAGHVCKGEYVRELIIKISRGVK